ncbi:MAG: hypothetical protein Q7S13_00055, partial [Candidatus Omnitrophota bacterium]|nr:hypothetical protein [Candidatus Omnitrophota bacterium]
GEESFRMWYFYQYDYGPAKYSELLANGTPLKDIDQELYRLGIKNILSNPFQYTWMTMAEGMKMLFWESTRIGFVTYPLWLQNILYCTLFKNTVRLLMFLFTAFGLAFSIVYAWRHKAMFYLPSQRDNPNMMSILIPAFVIIFANILLHSPFIIETRYALPLAPLYLVLIGFSFNKLIDPPQS